MSFLKIWGCETYVKRKALSKLKPRSDKCIFVGYPKETKGYYFYNPIENKVFVSRCGAFIEKEFLLQRPSGSKIDFEEVPESMNTEPEVELNNQRVVDES